LTALPETAFGPLLGRFRCSWIFGFLLPHFELLKATPDLLDSFAVGSVD
jgi:hypothetical protein